MPLPENVSATYPDRGPGDTTHQQHHDEIHAAVNEVTEGRLSEAALSATIASSRPAQTRYVIQGQDVPALRIYPTIAAAVAASVSGDHIILDSGDHTVSASVAISDLDHLVIRGQGIRASRIVVDADVVALDYADCTYPVLRDLTVYCSTVGRTVFPVRVTDCTRPEVVDVYFDATGGARHAGIHLTGVGGVASMGVVRSCVFNHGCILVEVDDVKISNSWIWGQTNDYCVAVRDGSASVVLTDCDVVPPYATTATGIAAIVVGDDGSNPLNFKVNGLYLDGNPGLHVKAGVHIFNGVGGVILANIHANQMDHESIILDSCYNVLVNGYTSYANNRQGNGAPEILVRQTGVQPTENIRIRGAQFLQTEAVVGTPGRTIEVASSVYGEQVTIDGFDIKQPDSGGGYATPEISVPTSGGYPTVSMSGRGKLSTYQAEGSVAVAAGDSAVYGLNLSAPYPLAYRPRVSDIHFAFVGEHGAAVRSVEFVSDNQVHVRFTGATSGATTLHWRVDLRRA